MEKFSLKWNEFQASVTKSFGILRREKNLFDVTLVSDTEEHIPAHRLVLSACSDFFKNIFKKVDHQNPLIYLTGVSSGDIQMLLDYMYLGEVQILQEDLNHFLEVAEKLKIDGISGTIDEDSVNEKPRKDVIEELSKDNIVLMDDLKANRSIKNSLKHTGEVALTMDNAPNDEAKRAVDQVVYKEGDLWFCRCCNKSAKQSSQIRLHAELHIEGLTLPCPLCGDSFRSRQRLADHKRRQHKYTFIFLQVEKSVDQS